MNGNVEMVEVAAVLHPIKATNIQAELDTCGIDSELDGVAVTMANPLLSSASGGIKILVSAEDAERARSVLAENAKQRAEEKALHARRCPQCKSENGAALRRPGWGAVLALLTFGAYRCPKYRCPDCGHKWR